MSTQSFVLNELKPVEIQGLLQGAIGPRPIAFASTVNAKGEVNLSPFSFFNLFSSNPPIVGFSPARRVRDNTLKHTLENIQEVGEVCINVVNYDLVWQCSLSSTEYAQGVNEFVKSGLTEVASELIRPPRVKESPVQMECKVNQIISLGTEGGAGNLILCEVLKVHVREDLLIGPFQINQQKIDTVARMGGDWYCRAFGDALFEIEKPVRNKGIGVDQLPKSIRESHILSGNNLAQMGNVESMPTAAEIEQYLIDNPFDGSIEERELKAKKLLEEGKTMEAIKLLFKSN